MMHTINRCGVKRKVLFSCEGTRITKVKAILHGGGVEIRPPSLHLCSCVWSDPLGGQIPGNDSSTCHTAFYIYHLHAKIARLLNILFLLESCNINLTIFSWIQVDQAKAVDKMHWHHVTIEICSICIQSNSWMRFCLPLTATMTAMMTCHLHLRNWVGCRIVRRANKGPRSSPPMTREGQEKAYLPPPSSLVSLGGHP